MRGLLGAVLHPFLLGGATNLVDLGSSVFNKQSPEALQQLVDAEKKKLRIEEKVDVKIDDSIEWYLAGRAGVNPKYGDVPDGEQIGTIYLNPDYPKGKYVLRHELKHIRDLLDGRDHTKFPAETAPDLYRSLKNRYCAEALADIYALTGIDL